MSFVTPSRWIIIDHWSFILGKNTICLLYRSFAYGNGKNSMKFNSSPLKNGGWKTILSCWGPVTFQGRAVKLQGGILINFGKLSKHGVLISFVGVSFPTSGHLTSTAVRRAAWKWHSCKCTCRGWRNWTKVDKMGPVTRYKQGEIPLK